MTPAIAAILAGGLVPTIVGMVWYHPRVFGTLWLRLARVSPEMANAGQRRRTLYSLISLIGGVLAASAMYFVGFAAGLSESYELVGLWVFMWLGIVIPTSIGDVLWEQKPMMLYAIDMGYWLTSIVFMAMCITFSL